jgi:hypothetical protein
VSIFAFFPGCSVSILASFLAVMWLPSPLAVVCISSPPSWLSCGHLIR